MVVTVRVDVGGIVAAAVVVDVLVDGVAILSLTELYRFNISQAPVKCSTCCALDVVCGLCFHATPTISATGRWATRGGPGGLFPSATYGVPIKGPAGLGVVRLPRWRIRLSSRLV